MGSTHKSIQLILVFLKVPLLVQPFPTKRKWPLICVICDTAIYVDYNGLYCKCDRAFDLWHYKKLLAGEKICLLISMLEKVSFFHLNIQVAVVILKRIQKNLSSIKDNLKKMLELSFFSILGRDSTIVCFSRFVLSL